MFNIFDVFKCDMDKKGLEQAGLFVNVILFFSSLFGCYELLAYVAINFILCRIQWLL